MVFEASDLSTQSSPSPATLLGPRDLSSSSKGEDLCITYVLFMDLSTAADVFEQVSRSGNIKKISLGLCDFLSSKN